MNPRSVYNFLCSLFLIYFSSSQTDKTSKRNGGEIVAEVLKAHDVKFLFTLCGGHISPVNVAAEKLGIRVVDTRHEVSITMADQQAWGEEKTANRDSQCREIWPTHRKS